jgi:hypothetical protein
MSDKREDKLGELAAELDDLKISVEELKEDPPDHVEKKDLDTILTSLDEATDTTDELDDRTQK